MTASIAAVTTVVGFVLSVVTAGFGAFRTWIQVIHTLSSSRIVALESQSFASIMMRDRRNDNPHVLVPIVTDPPMWVVVIPLIVAFLLAVLVLIAAYERRDYAFPLMMVGITSIATACSGLVWTHYFQVALLPACGALALAVRRRLAGFLVMCLGLFFVPPLADVAGSTVHAKVHVVPGGLIALIGLILVMCVMALWRAPVRSRRRLGVNQWWEAYDGGGRGLELSSASLPRRYRRDLTGSLPVAAGASWLVRRRHGAL